MLSSAAVLHPTSRPTLLPVLRAAAAAAAAACMSVCVYHCHSSGISQSMLRAAVQLCNHCTPADTAGRETSGCTHFQRTALQLHAAAETASSSSSSSASDVVPAGSALHATATATVCHSPTGHWRAHLWSFHYRCLRLTLAPLPAPLTLHSHLTALRIASHHISSHTLSHIPTTPLSPVPHSSHCIPSSAVCWPEWVTPLLRRSASSLVPCHVGVLALLA